MSTSVDDEENVTVVVDYPSGPVATVVVGSPGAVSQVDAPTAVTSVVGGVLVEQVGDGSTELYISNTPPVAPAGPYLRIETDSNGDVQRILLGTP